MMKRPCVKTSEATRADMSRQRRMRKRQKLGKGIRKDFEKQVGEARKEFGKQDRELGKILGSRKGT